MELTPTGRHILQFRVENQEAAAPLSKVSVKDRKCDQQRGAAPRSALERVCQQLLQDMTGATSNTITKSV